MHFPYLGLHWISVSAIALHSSSSVASALDKHTSTCIGQLYTGLNKPTHMHLRKVNRLFTLQGKLRLSRKFSPESMRTKFTLQKISSSFPCKVSSAFSKSSPMTLFYWNSKMRENQSVSLSLNVLIQLFRPISSFLNQRLQSREENYWKISDCIQ